MPTRILACIYALVCFPAAAQVTGVITGSVVDSTGAVVPGATVNVYLAGGAKPILSTTTTSDGLYTFTGVRADLYSLTVEAKGFLKYTARNVKVYPARETGVALIKLELASVTQSVEVTAEAGTVQASNAQISSTITADQVRQLPLVDRDPLALIGTQAGVNVNARTFTVINGQRTSYGNITLDGVNIQDNFIRDNGLDYTPNLLLLDQVSEMTIVTSNADAAFGGGSAQVAFVTPSGTNNFHGRAVWQNRNNFFSANNWFNNKAGVERGFLNQNQMGGSIGGPIKKDKLLFYANYEALRLRQQDGVDTTILTDAARRGLFTYRDRDGVQRQVNVLQARSIQTDPYIQQLLSQVPGPESANTFTVGDSSPGLLRNTVGYRFLVRDNRTRDNVTGKLDYILSTKHLFSGAYIWNRDLVDRPDAGTDFSKVPKVTNEVTPKFVSASWRWVPGARLTNELRGGFNRYAADFNTTQKFGPYIIDGLSFTNPVNTFLPQGRNTNTYMLEDNASYDRGRHNVRFGYRMQQIRVRPFDNFGIVPTYFLDMGTGNPALSARDLTRIGATDLANANALLATLGGYIDSYSQTFNVTSRTSGFVSGASNVRRYSLNNYAWYLQDRWKLGQRLTLTLGLRHEISGVVDERDGLALFPVVKNNDPKTTLLSDSTLNFAGAAVGRPWYGRDANNLAPNIGVAWSPFANGRTVLRAGYSISYVNDEAVLSTVTSSGISEGLSLSSEDFGLTARISTSLPKIPKPVFKVPRNFSDNYDTNPVSAFGLIDPRLRTPYVQQWSFGIQHEFKGTIMDLRYVGNHAVKGFRDFDFNQVVIRENGFLDDFLRAYNNGNLARQANGVFNPLFNPNIPGSQRLTVFPKLDSGGFLNDPTVSTLIETGQPGQLGYLYQVNGLNGDIDFFRNPVALGTDFLTNYSNSTYNALQFDVRRRYSRGLTIEANYSFSKVLSDSAGTSDSRLEHFLDLANTKIERARADFDVTHAIKANGIFELPFGKGHALNPGFKPLSRVVSGWATSGIMTWQSGTPFSVLSGRGTLNRSSGTRSSGNTANTSLTKGQLDQLFTFRMTGDGPYFVAASAIGPDGRAVAPDGATPFNGQVFFHPGPGAIGALQRRMFSGPWLFDMDFALLKRTHITERHVIEFRAQALSVFNHPNFFVGDQAISSVNFGRVGDVSTAPRKLEFSLHYMF